MCQCLFYWLTGEGTPWWFHCARAERWPLPAISLLWLTSEQPNKEACQYVCLQRQVKGHCWRANVPCVKDIKNDICSFHIIENPDTQYTASHFPVRSRCMWKLYIFQRCHVTKSCSCMRVLKAHYAVLEKKFKLKFKLILISTLSISYLSKLKHIYFPHD